MSEYAPVVSPQTTEEEAYRAAIEHARRAQTFDYEIQPPRDETALVEAGDMVLRVVFGGALISNPLFPMAESITLEGLIGATKVGDRIQDKDLAASA